MTYFQSIILGFIQGLTEFLPVSSSGHLVIFQKIFKLKGVPIAYDVILHFATLIAVLIFFKNDLKRLISDNFKLSKEFLSTSKKKEFIIDNFKNNLYFKLLILIIIADIPTGLIGIFCKDYFEQIFSSYFIVCIMLLITGIFLLLTKLVKNKTGKGIKKITIKNSLVIGFIQGISIIPGISRSGSTITTSLFLGINREIAARFSFLMSIPAIFGATILEAKHLVNIDISFSVIFIGFISAFITGYFSLFLLIKIIKGFKFHIFGYYCIIISLIGIIFYLI